METLLHDVRFAARAMARRPLPTLLALLTFALGIAASTAMFGLVLAHALRLAAGGAVIGILASFIATRAIEAYLWGAAPSDPITFVGTAAALAIACVLAALPPARGPLASTRSRAAGRLAQPHLRQGL